MAASGRRVWKSPIPHGLGKTQCQMGVEKHSKVMGLEKPSMREAVHDGLGKAQATNRHGLGSSDLK